MPSTLTVALGTPPSNGRPDYVHLHRGSILNRNPSIYGAADRALMAAIGPHASRCFVRWEWATNGPGWTSGPPVPGWDPGDPLDFTMNPNFTLATSWLSQLPSTELIICQEGLIDVAWATVNSAWLAQQANQDVYEDMQVAAFAHYKTLRPELRWVGMLNEPDISINGGWSGADIYRLLRTTIKAVVRVNALGLPGPALKVLGPEAIHTFIEAASNPKAPGFVSAIAADASWWNSTGKPNMGGLSLHTFANASQINRLVTMTGSTGFRGLDLLAAASTLPTMFDGIPRIITAYSRETGGANPDDIQLGDGKGPDEQPTTLKMAQQSAFYVAFDELAARYVSPAGDRLDYAIMFSETNYIDYSNTLLRSFSQAGNFQLNGGAGWVDGTRTPVYNATVLRRRVADNTSNGVRHQVTGTGTEWANSVPNTNSGVFMSAQAVTQPGVGKVWCLLARVRNTSNLTPQAITVQWSQLATILKTTDPITVDAWQIDRDTSMMSPVTGQGGALVKVIDGALLTIPGAGLPSTVVQMPDPSIVLIELTGTPADGGSTEFGSAALAGAGTVTASATITAQAAASLTGSGSLVGSSGGTTHIGSGIMAASGTLDGGTPVITAVAAGLLLEVISELDATAAETGSASLSATSTLTALPVLDGPAVVASQLSVSTGDGTTLTMAKAGAHQPGDLAVLVIASDDATATQAIDLAAPPAGFVGVSRTGNATSDAEVGVFVRRAQVGGEVDGTDLPETVTYTAPVTSRLVAWWVRVVGAGATPVHALGSGAILDNVTSLTVPGATTTVPATLALLAVATDGGDTLPWSIGGDWGTGSAWPANLTGQSVNLGGAVGIGAGWMARPIPAPGTTGDATITTVATDGMAGLQVAIAGPLTVTASATLTAEATVTASAVLVWDGAAELTGTGTLTATPAGGALTPVITAQQLAVNTVDATSLVLTKPGPGAVGDVALLIVANDDVLGAPAFGALAGWQLLELAGNATSDAEIAVYYRRAVAGGEADGTDLPATVTVTTATTCRIAGWWVRVTGVASTVFISSGPLATAGAAPVTVDGSTVLVGEALALLVAATDGGDTLPWSVAGTGWPGAWPTGTLAGDLVNTGGAVGVGAGWMARPFIGPGSVDAATISTAGALDGIAAFQLTLTGVPNVVTASAALVGAGTLTASAFTGTPPPVVQAWAVATSTGPEPQLVLTKPAPFAVGDLAVLVVFTDDDESGFGIDTPAGWTYVDGAGTTASDAEVAVFVRFAAAGGEVDGTDLPATVTVADVSPTPGRHGGYWLRLTGAAGGVSVVGTRATTGNATTLPVPSLTTPTANNLVLLAVSTDGGDTLPWAVTGDGWPGSWPSDLSGQSVGLGAATGVGGGWVARVAAEAGPVPAPTVGTALSDGISAVQLAIASRVPQLVEGAAALDAAGSVTAAAIRSVPGAASLPATLALVASASDRLGAATLTTGLTASAAGTVTVVGASALGQALTATTAGARQFTGALAATVTTAIVVEPGDVLGAVSLPVTVDIDATPAGDPIPGEVALPTDLVLAALGIVERPGTATLPTSWAASAGTATVRVGAATLPASWAVTAGGSGVVGGAADLAGEATVTASAVLTVAASAALAASASCEASPSGTALGAASLPVTVAASAGAGRQVFGSASAPMELGAVVLAAVDVIGAGIRLMGDRDLIRFRPALADDGYGNLVPDVGQGDRRRFRGWLQEDVRTEGYADGRRPARQVWLLITELADLVAGDRVEWWEHPDGDPITFEVEGPPEPAYQGRRWHHTEATLRLVEG